MNDHTTPKGTKLPLLDLRGKPYLMVAHRLVWFREEKPEWSIETEIIQATDKFVTCKATIKNELGRVMATAHKTEHFLHFGDALEKAESSSIGRALAMCGFGTQFVSDELDEGSRLADSPVMPKKTVRSDVFIDKGPLRL